MPPRPRSAVTDVVPPPSSVVFLPAIDLRRGRCVRLERGDADRETAYGAEPLEVARCFAASGAEWVHVVDLDAAFGEGSNRALIASLSAETPLRVQTGGGLRTEADLEEVFAAGVSRAVIGTAAIENPDLVRRAMERWGAEKIAVGLDARGNRPAVRGWREESSAELFELASALAELGVRTFVHTDIDRDGMMRGPNLALSAEIAERSGAEVMVSGGIRGTEDVQAVAAAASAGARLSGVIVGKAIYEGRMTVGDGVAAAART